MGISLPSFPLPWCNLARQRYKRVFLLKRKEFHPPALLAASRLLLSALTGDLQVVALEVMLTLLGSRGVLMFKW